MRLPRVKPGHEPFRTGPRTVRVGGDVYGVAAEITDPDGLAWAALTAMDGSRTAEDVVAAVLEAVPGATAARARAVVRALVASGHVEDAAAPPPPELSARELDRYSRTQAYYRHVDRTPREHGWHAQLALRRSSVLVVGLGGTGGHAAWALTAAGVGRLHCVDADVVELSNLSRQVLYDERDVGRPKAEAALDRLRPVNSGVELTGERRRVTGPGDLAALAADHDVLALCADEPGGPDGIRAWADRTGKPWVGGGYHGPLVTVGVFAPGGPCHACLAAGEAERVGSAPSGPRGAGATPASAGLSGLLTAQAVLTLLTGTPPLEPGYVHGLNLLAPGAPVYARHPPRPGCGTCRAP